MAVVLVTILEVFSLMLLVRALLSWFRPQRGGLLGQVDDVLTTITEPVVGPVRRVLPRMGPFDFSALIVMVVINVVLVPIAASL
jgi:YggT family protein